MIHAKWGKKYEDMMWLHGGFSSLLEKGIWPMLTNGGCVRSQIPVGELSSLALVHDAPSWSRSAWSRCNF